MYALDIVRKREVLTLNFSEIQLQSFYGPVGHIEKDQPYVRGSSWRILHLLIRKDKGNAKRPEVQFLKNKKSNQMPLDILLYFL